MKIIRRAAVLALALAGLAAPGAQAGVLVNSAPDCAAGTTSKPFARWLDYANYELGPAGTFEKGATGWSLSGAGVVSGNETYYVHGAGESRSLRLPGGASATTPTICVGLEHPTIRFFARNAGSGLLGLGVTSTVAVSVQVETSLGVVTELPIGVVTHSGTWRPTLPMTVVANLLPLLPGEHTPVRFKLTALGGDWRVDDFYVDPYRRS
jgi:hypothetical protein